MTDARRLDTNVPGTFYVNTACIDCDTCRQIAPAVFSEVAGYSAVTRQPVTPEEERQAFQALLACPTAAIGSEKQEGLQAAIADFPMLIEDGIFYCGFTSRKSYGGSSYLITHPDGNWLVDAPRYMHHLADRFEALGGIRYIFLTHRDDVADADKYAARFQAERIIHVLEKSAQPDAEHIVEGREPIQWHTDFKLIPKPGHTNGHMVLLYRDRYLFTGDHLAWDRDLGALDAHRDFCWHSFEEQTQSMARLAQERFEWVLPGHGERVSLPEAEMRREMEQLVERMKR